VLFQKHTRNYYVVPEVLSSLEKAILLGKTDDAFYWTMEYVMMGDQFFSPLWSYLFQFAANSIGPADATIMVYLRTQHEADKGYRQLTTAGDDQAADEADDEIDRNRLRVLLETVRRLCEAPKTRTIDSIVRTFLMPYPVTTAERPYEPYRDRLHLASPPEGGSSGGPFGPTQIPSLSYIDEYEEGQDPKYSLFQLQSSDPPYLAPWANALVRLFEQVTAFDVTSEREGALEEFQKLERGVFYYAGLIYQCTEPCPSNKKLNATYILWDIIHRFKTEAVSNLIGVLREISDEISKHDNRRERPFLAMALLLTIRPWSIDLPDKMDIDEPAIDLAPLFEQNANELLEVHPDAVDYTTPEGKSLKRTVSDYLLVVQDVLKKSPQNSELPDAYFHMAYQMEVAREEAGMKDQKKTIAPQVPFLSFTPDAVIKAPDAAEEPKKGRRKPKTAADFKLDGFHVWTPEADQPDQANEAKKGLPWRGQFVPYSVNNNNNNTSNPHPFHECFSNVAPVLENKFKEGLFKGTYKHPLLAPQDVFFIPCTDGPKQAFNQCLLDELKIVFGIPALGTHCLYVDHLVEKVNKKQDWSAENFTITPDRGCHMVMFPISSLGFSNLVAVQDLQNVTVESLTTPLVKKAKAPFLTTDFTSVRQQVLSIFMFYVCLGVNKANLSKMILVADAENGDSSCHVAADSENMEEQLVRAANAKVVPIFELTAFSNQPFPEIFKKIRQTLLRALLIGEQDHFMLRFFDLIMQLDWDGIELVLGRFGAPVVEWSNVIRTNLRDLRCGWLLWSQHSEANQLVQRQKNQEKNRARSEKKRRAKEEASSTAKKRDEVSPPENPAATKKSKAEPETPDQAEKSAEAGE